MKFFKCLIVLLMCSAFAVGCGGSSEESAEEATANIIEETETVSENETDAETTEEDAAAVGVSTEETSAAQEGSSGEKVNEEIMEKAESGAKQTNSRAAANADKPAETTAPEGTRIVATSASICDITDRLGLSLVGVPETTVSAIVSRYEGVTTVGTPMSPDMEIIKSLNPTDVLTPDTLEGDLKIQYDNIGVNSTFLNLRNVKGLYDSVKLIGDKYGKSKEAEAIVAEYNEFMASYSSKHSGEKPKVLVLMGLPGSYLVATQNSYAGSLVELAGGENVFHDDTKDFLTVNTEEILAKDPDVIIRTAHGLPKEALEMFEKEFSENDIWKHFRAVQEGRVYDVDYMLFGMSATFDYPQALADLEPMLFP
ncbi:MAG: heme ABC transporter substrate-binding protein IsdE [Clostridiales bacterium]|nr:heme ABC transporter substrate-binding protein IsdE [Clostridiales bacterium]